MAMTRILDCMHLALRARRTMAPLSCAANFDPFSLGYPPPPLATLVGGWEGGDYRGTYGSRLEEGLHLTLWEPQKGEGREGVRAGIIRNRPAVWAGHT